MTLVYEGPAVRIRPVNEADLDVMDGWLRDADALGGFNPPVLRAPGRSRAQLLEYGYITPEYALFAVEKLDGDRRVGKVGYSKDSSTYDHMVRTYSIIGDPSDRGDGYATEARRPLINHLFLSTSLERVYSKTEEANAPAAARSRSVGCASKVCRATSSTTSATGRTWRSTRSSARHGVPLPSTRPTASPSWNRG